VVEGRNKGTSQKYQKNKLEKVKAQSFEVWPRKSYKWVLPSPIPKRKGAGGQKLKWEKPRNRKKRNLGITKKRSRMGSSYSHKT